MSTELDPVRSLKRSFSSHIVSSRRSRSYVLSKKRLTDFRIATYNIHYFTDVNEEKNTYEGILNDIKTINADVIGLQEFVYGYDILINKSGLKVSPHNFYNDVERFGYSKAIVCNSVPSWFSSIYGNIVLVKNTYCQPNKLCTELDETIYTFDKSTTSCTVSGTHAGTCETRCYVKLRYEYNGYTFYIYVTHLDVASEETRLKQMNYMIDDSLTHRGRNNVVFIMGDFNTADRSELQYRSPNYTSNQFLRPMGRVVDLLSDRGFIDCHKDHIDMTVWTGIRVDFIFCNKKIIGNDHSAEVLFTENSDHLPVVLTIGENARFV